VETVRLGRLACAFALGLASACGGQSLVHSDDGDDGSNGGNGGTGGNSGNAGAGGSFTGGTSAGGTFTGGTSAGGSSAGGSSFGGTSTGGISFGGTGTGAVAGTAGTGGAAGAGGVCSLPIESGPCDGYVPSYGFSQADGNCQSFVYGGCQGNDNRFSTLAECEAKCGGALSRCPEYMPMGATCSSEGQACTYAHSGCLCTPRPARLDCPVANPGCINADAGVSEIVIVLYNQCTCTNGAWDCRAVTSGGR